MEAGICDCHLHPRKAMLSPPCGAERHHPVLRVQVAMRGLPQRAPTTLSQPGSASDCCEALDNWLKSSESQVPPLYRLFFHFLWKSESTRELFFFLHSGFRWHEKDAQGGIHIFTKFLRRIQTTGLGDLKVPCGSDWFHISEVPRRTSGGLISGLTLGDPAFTLKLRMPWSLEGSAGPLRAVHPQERAGCEVTSSLLSLQGWSGCEHQVGARSIRKSVKVSW